MILKALLSTNDLSKLWLPTLGFKDGFEKNVTLQKISGLSVTFLSALSLYGHPSRQAHLLELFRPDLRTLTKELHGTGKKYYQVLRLP